MKSVHIEIISDFICPWCYLGKVRLDKIKSRLSHEIHLNIHTKPYILYPFIPVGGLPKADFAKKTKPGMGKSLRKEAEVEGITFNYKHIERIPNSLEAHRLISLIEDTQLQYALTKQIFHGYFEEGQNIEDSIYLSTLAKEIGVLSSTLDRFQHSLAGAEKVQLALSQNQEEFITVVPSLRLDKKIILPGLQSTETWESYIRRAAAMQD